MGFSVTGIDVSPGMVRIARKRVRKIPFHGSSTLPEYRFLVLDAHDLPFENRFDAAIVYDTLHHFEKEGEVLKSIFRSLVPGGRIFLKEPPETHPESPGAQAEMRDFGVLEKGFSRERLHALLESAGFTAVRFHLPAAFLVPEDRVFGPYLESVIRASHREHRVTAWKPPVVPDSRFPSRLSARYRIRNTVPERLQPGEFFDVTIEIENDGDTIWRILPAPTGGHVRLAVILETPSGDVLDDHFGSAVPEKDVFPKEKAVLNLKLKAPEKPGRYIMRFHLLAELLHWFDRHLSISVNVDG
jgi:SAM-dependent methyltransferase